MKTTVLLSITSALFLAAAAGAHSRPAQGRDRPARHELAEVQKLAHEVEDRAREVRRAAERHAHSYLGGQQLALRRLYELEENAAHFHRQVELYRQNLRHTEGDFRQVQRAFVRVSYTIDELRSWRRVDREFELLSDAMYDLEMYAEVLFGRVRPARRHGWDADSDSDSDSRRFRRSRRSHHAGIVLPRVRVFWSWFDN